MTKKKGYNPTRRFQLGDIPLCRRKDKEGLVKRALELESSDSYKGVEEEKERLRRMILEEENMRKIYEMWWRDEPCHIGHLWYYLSDKEIDTLSEISEKVKERIEEYERERVIGAINKRV